MSFIDTEYSKFLEFCQKDDQKISRGVKVIENNDDVKKSPSEPIPKPTPALCIQPQILPIPEPIRVKIQNPKQEFKSELKSELKPAIEPSKPRPLPPHIRKAFNQILNEASQPPKSTSNVTSIFCKKRS